MAGTDTFTMETNMVHPGATDFDVADRLAIINLCNSYARYFDMGDLDGWFRLFTENVTCSIYLSDAEPITVVGDEFRNYLRDFRSGVDARGFAPHHYNTNVSVQQQTDNSAIVESYMLYIPLEIAALNSPEETLTKTRITGTACYLFELLKGDDGIWRIDKYKITYKQLVPDPPVGDLAEG